MTHTAFTQERVDRLDELFVLDEPKLRQLAFALKRQDKSVTLTVTALVNQAYMRLREGAPELESQLHLRRMAGRVMRHILVDAARARAAVKRGGDGSVSFVNLDELAESSVLNDRDLLANDRDLLALDNALTRLAELNSRQHEIVEAHFFGGLKWQEVADLLGISIKTVERDWRAVRLWLKEQVKQGR